MNADAKNTIPDQGGAEAMQADSIAIPTKVEGSETVAVYIKAGTEKQMSEYVDVLERTKQKLRERGLEYHDVKFGGGTVTGLLGVSMPKTGEARDTYEKEFDILKFTVESTRSRAPVWPNEVSDGVIGSVAQEIAVAVKCAPNGIDVRGGFECSAGKVDEAKFKGGGLFAVNAKKSEFKEMLARLQGSDYGKLKHFSLEEGGPGLRVGAGNWSTESVETTVVPPSDGAPVGALLCRAPRPPPGVAAHFVGLLMPELTAAAVVVQMRTHR